METTQNQKNKYWQTLEQWRQDEEFKLLASQEFSNSPLREDEGAEGGWARREFLKLMGASLALTSFGCVRRPAQKIVPYVQRPKDFVEGIANYYASSFSDGSETLGVVVTTREGRPIHVTGNTLHPLNSGGMSARAHAHILSLYDPDRLQGPVKNLLNDQRTNRETVSVDIEKADQEIAERIRKGKVAVLTSSVVSPSLNLVMNEFASATGAKIYTWDSQCHEKYVQGQLKSFGSQVAPRLVLEKSKYTLAINNDFLGTWLQPVQQMASFGLTRKPGANMSRLVVFESLLSLTGTNADSRYRIRPSHSVHVAMGLLHQLLVKKAVSSYASDGQIISVVKEYADAESELGLPEGTLSKIASELWDNRGKSLVLAGEDLATQVACNLLNAVLGNDGITIDARRSFNTGFQGSNSDLAELTAAIKAERVSTLIIAGVNPVYSAPGQNGFLEALQTKGLFSVATNDRNDETAKYCDYVIPDHHAMEGWGDSEGQKGVYSIQQPTIEPLYKTRGLGDSLIAWAKAAKVGGPSRHESFYNVVKSQAGNLGVSNWNQFLQEGVLGRGSRTGEESGRRFNSAAILNAKRQDTPKSDLELVLYSSVGLRDGSLANVPWLQEFPDPVAKICWDNYLTVSHKYAEENHLQEGQVVELTAGGQTVKVPVHIQPGQHDSALGLALGYGRTSVGSVGNGVGINAFRLAGFNKGEVRWSGIIASLKPTKAISPLASTQGHHYMEGRQIVVEATLAQYKENPAANIHRHKVFSAWSEHKYESYKWGMSIDLNQCTGCSACVIACQSENNIPIVGKKYVIQQREMHWIRIDRYYVGDPNDPDTVHMPLLCQHCDNAPCETVCPVAATTHSTEGLNEMIYNRCVGTRYCSNNCPYKVRRFNWFNYARMNPELYASPLHMQLNPEVTVRGRGVMEKCTFCTQKIQSARSVAKLEDRRIQDGDIVTACEAACPTKAITFGDLNDPASRVSKILKDQRYYPLLEELNTRPAVQYASKIRNTNVLKGEHKHEGNGDHS